MWDSLFNAQVTFGEVSTAGRSKLILLHLPWLDLDCVAPHSPDPHAPLGSEASSGGINIHRCLSCCVDSENHVG